MITGLNSILIMSSVRWYNASAHYALNLARGLARAGVRTVIFGIPGSPIIEKAKKEGFPVIDDINLMDKNPLSYIKSLNKFKQLIIQNKFDIINPHISRDHTFAFISLSGGKLPVVRTRTDSIPPKKNLFNKWFYSVSCSHFIVSSEFMAEHIKDLGIDNKKISVVPLDLNFREFADYKPGENLREKLNIPDGRIIVSFAGRLDKIKGVEYFIKSHPYLKNRENMHYLISGEEINLSIEKLKRTADNLNIKNISIINRVKDIREILSVTDIGVIPSIGSEAICRIALEMLSFGIPVIGSNINSIPETIKDYDGIIVNPGSGEEIASAIDLLAVDENYKKKKTVILKKINQKSPDKFINEYIDIFLKQIGAQ